MERSFPAYGVPDRSIYDAYVSGNPGTHNIDWILDLDPCLHPLIIEQRGKAPGATHSPIQRIIKDRATKFQIPQELESPLAEIALNSATRKKWFEECFARAGMWHVKMWEAVIVLEMLPAAAASKDEGIRGDLEPRFSVFFSLISEIKRSIVKISEIHIDLKARYRDIIERMYDTSRSLYEESLARQLAKQQDRAHAYKAFRGSVLPELSPQGKTLAVLAQNEQVVCDALHQGDVDGFVDELKKAYEESIEKKAEEEERS